MPGRTIFSAARGDERRQEAAFRSDRSERRQALTDETSFGTTGEAALANETEQLANRQWRDYRARQPGTCFADPDFALSLAAAYELQDAVAKLRVASGDRLIGYKVGCTGPGTTQQFGMQGPIRGRLFKSEVRRHGEALKEDDFAHLAIEGEMAIRIAPDYTIEAAFPVIELHHYVFRAPRKTLPELVANNGLNAGFVPPPDDWLSSRAYIDGARALSVRINGRPVASGELWPMAGGAEASLKWLRRQLAATHADLAPGNIILTGTPLGLYPVSKGDHVEVLIDDHVGPFCSIV
jgi:2-keto-4-pentenoate hydratase